MAHLAALNQLTDELVRAIAGNDPQRNAKAFETSKDATSRAIRQHRYPRTNQFHVERTFSGLIEKFQVLNKDPLADALDARVQELATRANKWTPDVLSLLLHLSDNPAEKSNVDDLEALKQQNEPSPLTWSEVLTEDPVGQEDSGLWNDVDFASSDSDQDEEIALSEDASDGSEHTRVSSIASDDKGVNISLLLAQPDREGFKALRKQLKLRHQRVNTDTVTITELESVREVLNMLHGLPSRLYKFKTLEVVPKYRLAHFSQTGFCDILDGFADVGRTTEVLRGFCGREQTRPLLQSFSTAISTAVQAFDAAISKLEARLVGIKGPVVVSLPALYTDVESLVGHLPELAKLVSPSNVEKHEQTPHKLLDNLYDLVCSAQAVGDASKLEPVAQVFFICLQTYLKQVSHWMEHGSLDIEDQTFVVQDKDTSPNISSFWQHRFALRYNEDRKLQAPTFMHAFAPEILSSGKSVAFIKALGIEHMLHQTHTTSQKKSTQDPAVDFSSLHNSLTTASLLPFSITLHHSLHKHLSRPHSQHTHLLRTHLTQHHHLLPTLHALQTVFLSRNGSFYSNFTSDIYPLIDDLQYTRSDTRLFLEESARTTFGETPYVDARCISLTLVPPSRQSQRLKRRTVRSLSCIVLGYRTDPVLSNILPIATLIPTLQSLFTLLVQIRYPKHLLSVSRRHLSLPDVTSREGGKVRNLMLSLHQRLLNTVLVMEEYILLTALSPPLLAFEKAVSDEKATPTIDALVSAAEILDRGLYSRGLLSASLKTAREAIVGILDLGVAFCGLLEGEDVVNDAGKLLDRLRKMKSQYEELLRLLVAELRTASRGEDGEGSWGVLAERLGW